MPQDQTCDVNFFSLVHNVLQATKEDSVERRGGSRHKYLCPQLIAPYREGRLPRADEFRRVMCYDLSGRGFSFLSDDSPGCEYLVVALGKSPYMFVSTQVMHESQKCAEHGGQMIIGCRFLSRIEGYSCGWAEDR